MSPTKVSVIVVSRGRAAALDRCLTGLAQLYHHPFELVVVADPAGCAAVQARTDAGRITLVPFDAPNISAARNLGAAAAGGPVLAFIDDDAVPEPVWLDRLLAPFDADPSVAAAGGFVLGRNGHSLQWGARAVDGTGGARPLRLSGAPWEVPGLAHGEAVKTEGTNMAIRRDVLEALGGFDPGFRFYLDETDLDLRLARAGHRVALVPGALVHHGYFPSERRRADRLPLDLHDIGASSALFWARHAPDRAEPARARLRAAQRARLIRFLRRGACSRREMARLLATLEAGLAEGPGRLAEGPPGIGPAPAFRPYRDAPRAARAVLLAGRPAAAGALCVRARRLAEEGVVPTVLLLSRLPWRHHARFDPGGFWLQTGGQGGRGARDRPPPLATGYAARVAAERARLAPLRSRDGFEAVEP